MNKLAEKVKSLFTEDLVKLVIGFEKGSHGVRPFFCRNIEEADKLVWDDFCTNNIAVYLTKTELFGTDKTALFANLPALRTILQLASENQLKQEQWIILTLNAQEEVIQFDSFEDGNIGFMKCQNALSVMPVVQLAHCVIAIDALLK